MNHNTTQSNTNSCICVSSKVKHREAKSRNRVSLLYPLAPSHTHWSAPPLISHSKHHHNFLLIVYKVNQVCKIQNKQIKWFNINNCATHIYMKIFYEVDQWKWWHGHPKCFPKKMPTELPIISQWSSFTSWSFTSFALSPSVTGINSRRLSDHHSCCVTTKLDYNIG